VPEYNSWRQVAGYFDGDGTIALSDLSNQPFKLGLSLIFVDQSSEQILNVLTFLRNHAVRTSNVLKTSKGTANMVAVSQFDSVKSTLRHMLPFLVKKSNEARVALDYYEGKIRGNDLLALFQKEVEDGRRERRTRKVAINVPYTYLEGDKMMKFRRRERLRDAFGKFRAKVTMEDFQEVRKKYFAGASMRELMDEYPNYCRSTIARIIGKDRACVLVSGRGLVHASSNQESAMEDC
jgi:hypothetical protein